VALLIEVVVEAGVDRGELLQRLHSPKPQHRPLSSSERLVGVLDRLLAQRPTSCRSAMLSSFRAALYRTFIVPKRNRRTATLVDVRRGIAGSTPQLRSGADTHRVNAGGAVVRRRPFSAADCRRRPGDSPHKQPATLRR